LIIGVVVTMIVWAIFVYIAVRGLKTEIPDAGSARPWMCRALTSPPR
jgi:hypothetical protein